MVTAAFNETGPGPRPQALPVRRDGIPQELAERERWLVWRYELNKDGTKWTKVPYDAHTGTHGSSTNADTWATLDVAYKCYISDGYDGIGYAIDPEDGIIGIDIDHCLNDDGTLTERAIAIIARFKSYTERSPGRNGLRVFVYGHVEIGNRKGGQRRDGVEMYPKGQYLTCTGHGLEGFVDTITQAPDGALQELWDSLNPPRQTSEPRTPREPGGASAPRLDDAALIAQASSAANGAKFVRLWNGDTSDHDHNDSVADMALCSHLAFWTCGDAGRMDALFRQSGLYREKWDSRRGAGTYGAVTIEKAITNCTEFYKPRLHVVGRQASTNRRDDPTGARSSTEDGASVVPPVDPDVDLAKLSATAINDFLGHQEQGDADLLAKLYRNRLLYCPIKKQWYAWETHRWRESSIGEIRLLVTRQVSRQYDLQAAEAAQLAANAHDEGEKKAHQATADANLTRARTLQTKRRVDAVIGLAEGVCQRPDDWQWDANEWLLGVVNGVLDLEARIFRAGKPDDRILSFSPMPWTGIDTPAPLWERTVAQIFEGQPDMPPYMQRLFGYAITGSARARILPIFYGANGHNGKDTIVETIAKVLGPSLAGPCSRDVFMGGKHEAEGRQGAPTPHIMALRGKRLVYNPEASEGGTLNAEQIKRATGNNTLSGRDPHAKKEEQFKPTHLAILTTNDKPAAPAGDNALWGRIKLTEFKYSYVEEPAKPNERQRDGTLAVRLLGEEASGILAWLVAGCYRWLEVGLDEPERVKMATSEWQKDEDLLGQYIDEYYMEAPGLTARGVDFYHGYCAYLEQYHGYREGRGPTARGVGRELAKRYESRRSMGTVYIGLARRREGP